MLRRLSGFASFVALLAMPSIAQADTWCNGDPSKAPCIESAARDGVAISESDPTWFVRLGSYDDLSGSFLDVVSKVDTGRGVAAPPNALYHNLPAYQLPRSEAGHTWSVTVLTHAQPDAVTSFGNAIVDRNVPGADGLQRFTVYGSPLTVLKPDCRFNSPCEEVATEDRTSFFHIVYFDGRQFNPDVSTNIGGFDASPNWVEDHQTGEIYYVAPLASSHFFTDGVTVFRGLYRATYSAFHLNRYYEIDDLASLDDASVIVLGAAGATSEVTVLEDAVRVTISELTFSERKVKIGILGVTPTKPANLRARRVGADRARLSFEPASSRGSSVRDYKAVCVPRGEGEDRIAKAPSPPIAVKGLQPDTAYECKVRARSKAGNSPAATARVGR
jgi:Fibronectin type III domain